MEDFRRVQVVSPETEASLPNPRQTILKDPETTKAKEAVSLKNGPEDHTGLLNKGIDHVSDSLNSSCTRFTDGNEKPPSWDFDMTPGLPKNTVKTNNESWDFDLPLARKTSVPSPGLVSARAEDAGIEAPSRAAKDSAIRNPMICTRRCEGRSEGSRIPDDTVALASDIAKSEGAKSFEMLNRGQSWVAVTHQGSGTQDIPSLRGEQKPYLNSELRPRSSKKSRPLPFHEGLFSFELLGFYRREYSNGPCSTLRLRPIDYQTYLTSS